MRESVEMHFFLSNLQHDRPIHFEHIDCNSADCCQSLYFDAFISEMSGPSFEARVEDWRFRLRNTIVCALTRTLEK